jgi:hypothetical protein
MTHNLVMSKERFDYLQERMKDNVVMIKEETDSHGDKWIHFDITIETSMSVLALFHAGVSFGSDNMAKAFTKR